MGKIIAGDFKGHKIDKAKNGYKVSGFWYNLANITEKNTCGSCADE